jgi:hypothetical protein
MTPEEIAHLVSLEKRLDKLEELVGEALKMAEIFPAGKVLAKILRAGVNT